MRGRIIGALVLGLTLCAVAKPAHAFYLEVPQSIMAIFSDAFLPKKSSAAPQDGMSSMPPGAPGNSFAPGVSSAPMPAQPPVMPMPPGGGGQSSPAMPPTGDFKPLPPMPMMPPGNSPGMPQGQPSVPGTTADTMKTGAPNQGQLDQKQLEAAKQGALMLRNNLQKFEILMKDAEQKGIAIPTDAKAKLETAKGMLDQIKSVDSAESLQKMDLKDVEGTMGSLETARRDLAQDTQRLSQVKSGLKNVEQNVSQFEKQVARLQKQNIAVPANVTEILAKIKTIVAAAKSATTADALDASGVEDLRDLLDELNESRGSLEQLARWPQTLKQIDRQLTQMQQALKRAKVTADKLAKKDINVSGPYSEFEAAVAKLKSVRDTAVANIAAGSVQEAFDALQDDFFGQTEDVYQHMRVIETMGNLGRFATEFKTHITTAERQVKMLKVKKLETSGLEGIIIQAKAKGAEIQTLMKASSIDEEAIMAALQDMENLKQEFDVQMSEIAGATEQKGPQQGTDQFNSLQLPSGFEKLLQQNSSSTPTGTAR